MDGINGIAGVEAVTVCVGGALLYQASVAEGAGWAQPLLLMVAIIGFLFWNFPRARIFMGDVGSGFIGLMIGVISIQAAWYNAALFWAWVIMLGVFVVDATVTLIRRVLRHERFYEAHRSHAYQYAARKHGSHFKVTMAVAVINIGWLMPMAMLAVVGSLDGLVAVILAYLPLLSLALYYKAGAAELQK